MKSQQPSRPFLRLVGEPEEFHQGAWRAEQTLVLSHHATLPDRCVLCNHAAGGFTLRKRLLWHTPLLLPLLVLMPPLGPVLYGVLAWLLKKTMPVALPLCPGHLRRRRLLTGLGLALLPASPILTIAGISLSEPSLPLPGLLLTLAGIVVLLFGRIELWPLRITEDHAFLRGASEDWLATLPDWAEPEEDAAS